MWKSHIRHAFSLKQIDDVKIFLKDSEKTNDHTPANVVLLSLWSVTQPFQGKVSTQVCPSKMKNNTTCVSLAQGQRACLFIESIICLLG